MADLSRAWADQIVIERDDHPCLVQMQQRLETLPERQFTARASVVGIDRLPAMPARLRKAGQER